MINAPSWIEWLVFGLSFSAVAAIIALSAFSTLRADFRFFPPPSKQSWQHKAFIARFRLYLYPLVALTILVLQPVIGAFEWTKLLIGLILSVTGFGLAFRITLQLGWRNAFGEKRGLMTTGWFARSRNPIYVATWLGLIGWAIIVSDSRVVSLLFLWALMYLIAPRFEEPWLAQQYGDAFRAYKANTPRFL